MSEIGKVVGELVAEWRAKSEKSHDASYSGYPEQVAARMAEAIAYEQCADELESRLSAMQAGGGEELRQICAEAYQVVGSLLSDLGKFETPEAEKILDNLSQGRMVHADVLPWASYEAPTPPASSEPVAVDFEAMVVAASEAGEANIGNDPSATPDYEAAVRAVLRLLAYQPQPAPASSGAPGGGLTENERDLLAVLEARTGPMQPGFKRADISITGDEAATMVAALRRLSPVQAAGGDGVTEAHKELSEVMYAAGDTPDSFVWPCEWGEPVEADGFVILRGDPKLREWIKLMLDQARCPHTDTAALSAAPAGRGK